MKRTTTESGLVEDGNETPSSLVFSKQELLELSDYLRYAHENIREYAHETNQRNPGLPMVLTLKAYAARAQELRARIQSAL